MPQKTRLQLKEEILELVKLKEMLQQDLVASQQMARKIDEERTLHDGQALKEAKIRAIELTQQLDRARTSITRLETDYATLTSKLIAYESKSAHSPDDPRIAELEAELKEEQRKLRRLYDVMGFAVIKLVEMK